MHAPARLGKLSRTHEPWVIPLNATHIAPGATPIPPSIPLGATHIPPSIPLSATHIPPGATHRPGCGQGDVYPLMRAMLLRR